MNEPPAGTSAVTSPVEATLRVGFIGLGAMGLPLALRLLRSGVPVVVYNRTQAKAEALTGAGATWTATAKELARAVSKGVTFVMVSDGPAVKSVLFGRAGYARGAPEGALVVNLSTIDPDESRTFAARLAERGIRYIDAPVGGSVDQAAQGELIIFVGGEDSDIARVRPLLERLGRRVEHVGPTGAGNAMKLVNNLLTVGITVLSSEALSLAAGFGLDPQRTIELLQAGGGQSAMLGRKSAVFLARKYPAQFSTRLAQKDLRLIERAARRERRPLQMTREARKLLDEAMTQGHGDEDFSSVLEATLARGQVLKSGGTAPEAAPLAPPDAPGST